MPPEKHVSNVPKIISKRVEASYQVLQKMGWIRVVFFGMEGEYGISFNGGSERKPQGIQKDALVDLAKRLDVTTIRDDSNGERYNPELWESI